MKRFLAGFLMLAALGPAMSLPALADTADAPCTAETPCAKPFHGSGGYGVQLGGEATISSRFDRAYLAPQRYPKAKGLNLIITEKDGKIGFVNRDGIETEPPQYKISNFGDGSLIIVELEGKKCGINRHGVKILDCKYDTIFATATANTFLVKENGETKYINASGAALNFSQPSPAPEPAKPAPSKPSTFVAAPVSELERLVQERKWDEAVRLAAKSDEPRDIRDVLLIFNRSASTRDARYQAGKIAIYENIGMFQKATLATASIETSELLKMETNIRTWFEGPVYAPPSGGGYISASTVGECHRMGGTVTAMRNCAR